MRQKPPSREKSKLLIGRHSWIKRQNLPRQKHVYLRFEPRRTRAAAPPSIPQAAPNPFGNINFPQDGTLATLPFQPCRTQAMNPLFSDLINESLFKAISENILAPINILKLSTDYTPDREKMKAVDALEEDALLSEVKGSSHLLRCFLLYSTILLHFTQFPILYDQSPLFNQRC